MSIQLHEELYRGAPLLEKLAQTRFTVCGAGALGSLLVDNLVRHGAQQVRVIDQDRVEEHNIGTQIYDRDDLGAWKVEALAARCFRINEGEIETFAKTLDERTAPKLLRGADVIVDCLDNAAGRRLLTGWCRERNVTCLHLGVHTDYGEVVWNEGYQVPEDQAAPGACDYPLARNLLLLTVAAGCEALLRFLEQGEQARFSITLRDLSINSE